MNAWPVIRGLSALSWCCLTVSACSGGSGPLSCRAGQPDTVDFTALGTFRTDTLDQGGLTVTGSDSVNVIDLEGLAVVGGRYDSAVDGTSEFLKFAVDAGAATDVGYFMPYGGGPGDGTPIAEALVEAFDPSARSLGTRSVHPLIGALDVSALFDSLPISAVVLQSNGSGDFFRVGRASFTPCL